MSKFFNFLGGLAETAVKLTTGKDIDINNDGKNGVQVGTGYYKSWEKDSDGKFIQPKPSISNSKSPAGNKGGKPFPSKGNKDGGTSDDSEGGFMDMLMKPIMGIPLVALAIGGYILLPKIMGGNSAAPKRSYRRKRVRRSR